MQNKKIQLWALGMAGYNCTIEYIAGTENTCADLLSRRPDGVGVNEALDSFDLEINDNTFEVGVINSNEIDPKDFAGCIVPEFEQMEVPKCDLPGLDMIVEQAKDKDITDLKTTLEQGNPSQAIKRRYIIEHNIVYFLSDPDDNPTLRLFVPGHLRQAVVKQYHDDNGHIGVQKTYDSIRRKYFWPNLFQDLNEYVSSCTKCQTRSVKKVKPPLQETDVPPYPFAKLSLDLSGPYPKTLSGNKYIVAFVDWFSGWPEAFAVPDKTADTIAHLIIEEIFPRFGCPLELVTDNGSENVNRVVKDTLETLNIHHVTTSYYHPQSNSKVERFHRTLHDILSKRLTEGQETWDLHLNQVLAAIRFNVSETTDYTPFYLLYSRDVVLPIDNLLRPRTKYQGEDMHQISLQEQHKAFMLVHGRLKKQKRRQAKYANKNRKMVEFKIGDPVFYRKHIHSKLDLKWEPFYRIIEQCSPVNYVIKNQLDGKTVKVHAEHIKLAKVNEWQIPKTATGRPRRIAAYVVPPESDHSDTSGESSNSDSTNIQLKLAKKYRRERENTSDEEDIPLMELSKRLKNRESRVAAGDPRMSDDVDASSDTDSVKTIDYDWSDSMMVEGVQNPSPDSGKPRKRSYRSRKDREDKMKTLFSAIAGMF